MRALLLATSFLICTPSFAQKGYIDSLKNILKTEKKDTSRAKILYKLSYEYVLTKPDTALLLAQEAYDISVRKNFLTGEAWSLAQMGNAFRELGNNAQAIWYYLEQLKIEEKRKIPENLATVNMAISLAYNREKDTANAIRYIHLADSIVDANNIQYLKIYTLLNKGDIYEKANRLQDAMQYTRQAYNLAATENDTIILGAALNNLGNILLKQDQPLEAIKNYGQGIAFLKYANDNKSLSEAYLGIAKAFYNETELDSALLFAKKSYSISAGDGFLKNAVQTTNFLSVLYGKLDNIDSAFSYLQKTFVLKDSVESMEKIKKIESLTIEEKLRQMHLTALLEAEKEERRQKLELLAIGITIPMFFLFSFYISRRKIKKKLVTFFGIFSLLFLFEYLTLFIHPFVQKISHHSPVIEIIIFVAIAALMIPAHHRIEHWFTKRLVLIHERRFIHPPVVEAIERENLSGQEIIPSEKTEEPEVKVIIANTAPQEYIHEPGTITDADDSTEEPIPPQTGDTNTGEKPPDELA